MRRRFAYGPVLPALPPTSLAPMWRTAVLWIMRDDPRGQHIVGALRRIELRWMRRRSHGHNRHRSRRRVGISIEAKHPPDRDAVADVLLALAKAQRAKALAGHPPASTDDPKETDNR